MKLFVTGTESFVGRELIRQCDKLNIEVSGCDLQDSRGGRFAKMDINSGDLVDVIPDGIDAIVHLAALSTDKQCRQDVYGCFQTNVLGTLNVIRCAEKRNAKQFVFASTEWVYDSFELNVSKDERSYIDIQKLDSEYALSKLVSESNLRQQYKNGFCPVTILRFGIIYGPREKGGSAVESLLACIRESDEVTVGSAGTGRCFIHVSDIAKGIINSIGLKGFNILNLQGKKLITLRDIIETSGTLLGKKPVIIEKDPANPSVRMVSNVMAREILSWQPEVELDSGIKGILSRSE